MTVNIVLAENENKTEANNVEITTNAIDLSFRDVLLDAIDKLERENVQRKQDVLEAEALTDKSDNLDINTDSDAAIPIALRILRRNYTYDLDDDIIQTLFLKYKVKNKDGNEYDFSPNDDPNSSSTNAPPTTEPKIDSISQYLMKRKLRNKPSTTTTTTTTTTTRKPTHNSDGENIEVVDKQDIKIFQAPLVTAFTLQQDGRGVPNKIIPILDTHTKRISSTNPPILPTPATDFAIKPGLRQPLRNSLDTLSDIFPRSAFLPSATINSENRIKAPTTTNLPSYQNTAAKDSVNTDNNLIRSSSQYTNDPNGEPLQSNSIDRLILERQKALEEQIRDLKEQARQQQQQILLQQQLLKGHESRTKPITTVQPTTIKSSDSVVIKSIQAPLEIIPSISQPPIREYFNREQALPLPQHGNFHSSTFPVHKPQITSVQILPANQFSYVENSNFLPTFSSSTDFPLFQQLPQKPAQAFNQPSTTLFTPFQSLNPTFVQYPKSHKTRVFRHETGSGTFGTSSITQASQPNIIDSQLQNLLYQTGVPLSPHDDLGVISKILAYNHAINGQQPQTNYWFSQYTHNF